jgi:hypothetical protein
LQKGMNCLRSLGNRDRGFESHSGHGCLVCVCAFFCVYVHVEALRRADHPPKESLGEVHGGRPRPTGAVVPREKKVAKILISYTCQNYQTIFVITTHKLYHYTRNMLLNIVS